MRNLVIKRLEAGRLEAEEYSGPLNGDIPEDMYRLEELSDEELLDLYTSLIGFEG